MRRRHSVANVSGKSPKAARSSLTLFCGAASPSESGFIGRLLLPDNFFLHGVLRIARAALFRAAGPRFVPYTCEVEKSIPDNLAEAYTLCACSLLCLLKHGTIYPCREIHGVIDDARPSCAHSSSTSW